MDSVLTCISTGGPATTVTWTRDSELLPDNGDNTHKAILENRQLGQYIHTLNVTKTATVVSGVYGCSVSNSKPSSAKALLNTAGIHLPYSYRILVHNLYIVAGISQISISSNTLTIVYVLGGSVTLTCSAVFLSENTSEDYVWSGPGVVGRNTKSGVLTLSDIWASQAGQYNCTATHSTLSISTTVDITVKCMYE